MPVREAAHLLVDLARRQTLVLELLDLGEGDLAPDPPHLAEILSRVYEADGYFERLRRTVLPLSRLDLGAAVFLRDAWRDSRRLFGILWEVTVHRPAIRGRVWRLFLECLIRNPRALHVLLYAVVFFLYLEPLTAYAVRETNRQIDDIETGRWRSPLQLPRIELQPVTAV